MLKSLKGTRRHLKKVGVELLAEGKSLKVLCGNGANLHRPTLN